MNGEKISAAIYTRISSDPNGDGLGIKRQREDCLELVRDRGYRLFGIYEDNDVSAFSGKHRSEYARMMSDVLSGLVDVIVAWDPDRLHRNPGELEQFISTVEEAQCHVETVRSGLYDLTTDDGRFVARIVGAVARKESEQKSARLRRKHLEIAKAGRISGGGTRPFGFSDDRMTIVEEEAILIREAVDLVLSGRSIGSIVKEWDRRGIKTTTGKVWRSTSLRRMLTSARIAGIRELRDEVEVEAVWPPIIAKADLIKLRKQLLDPSRRTNHGARKYLLTGGLVTCGLCGSNLVARPRSDRRRCYVCASDVAVGGCGKIRVLAEPLEAAIVEMALQALDDGALAEVLLRQGRSDDQESEEAMKELEDAYKALEEIDAMFGDGEINKVSYLEIARRVKRRIESAEARIAAHTSPIAARILAERTNKLRESWGNLDIQDQRMIIALLIESVPIKPAIRGRNFFSAERIGSPIWRH